MKKIFLTAFLFLAVFLGFNISGANASMPTNACAMSKTKKTRNMKRFFRMHSLNFRFNFYIFHPGPFWVYKNAKVLKLTPVQVLQEKMLAKEMMNDTKQGIKTLKKAILGYRTASMQKNPSIKESISRVKAVGEAETYLGYVMIPSHIKAYRLLDPSQRMMYLKLAKIKAAKMRKMIH
ncbi:hypothetical protein ACMCNP_05235 [Candidatus Acidulodesulfobacterium sp. H_13]|uniref:hypothetical protein n=1 Tax=Candidatus Acidulodesulfobacterium sp. H_13 TaxID=3395470 RepID=UPI003AF6E04E